MGTGRVVGGDREDGRWGQGGEGGGWGGGGYILSDLVVHTHSGSPTTDVMLTCFALRVMNIG